MDTVATIFQGRRPDGTIFVNLIRFIINSFIKGPPSTSHDINKAYLQKV